MKTGRLLKFHRAGVDVHAYIYRDAGAFQAAVYVMTPERRQHSEPVHALSGATEAAVEEAVRAWVEARYPRSG